MVHVYSQLLAEGYTRSRQGNGTFVNASLPDSFLSSGRRARLAAAPQPRPALSPRGAAIVDGASASPYQWGAFMPGVPDLTEFPHRKFGRIVSALWRNPPPDLLTYAHGGGLPALREALAQHLALTRSIDCDPEQLIITEGSHQAIDLASRILGDPGEVAWVEDPAIGARAPCCRPMACASAICRWTRKACRCRRKPAASRRASSSSRRRISTRWGR